MREYPKIRILFTLECFEGWTVGGAWEDFSLVFKLPGIERIALVVDDTWDQWLTRLFKTFTAVSRSGSSGRIGTRRPGTGYVRIRKKPRY
jgi:hypothetical protein